MLRPESGSRRRRAGRQGGGSPAGQLPAIAGEVGLVGVAGSCRQPAERLSGVVGVQTHEVLQPHHPREALGAVADAGHEASVQLAVPSPARRRPEAVRRRAQGRRSRQAARAARASRRRPTEVDVPERLADVRAPGCDRCLVIGRSARSARATPLPAAFVVAGALDLHRAIVALCCPQRTRPRTEDASRSPGETRRRASAPIAGCAEKLTL